MKALHNICHNKVFKQQKKTFQTTHNQDKYTLDRLDVRGDFKPLASLLILTTFFFMNGPEKKPLNDDDFPDTSAETTPQHPALSGMQRCNKPSPKNMPVPKHSALECSNRLA